MWGHAECSRPTFVCFSMSLHSNLLLKLKKKKEIFRRKILRTSQIFMQNQGFVCGNLTEYNGTGEAKFPEKRFRKNVCMRWKCSHCDLLSGCVQLHVPHFVPVSRVFRVPTIPINYLKFKESYESRREMSTFPRIVSFNRKASCRDSIQYSPHARRKATMRPVSNT